jgi:TRAP-type C4-dicarboxylate transport system permease small subunit
MRLLEHLAAAILLALLVFGFANIVLRIVAGGGLIWFGDAGRYALVWMVLLGAAAVSFRGAHIAVDLGLIERLGPWQRRVVGLIRFLAIGGFLGILTLEGARLTLMTMPQTFITLRWLSLGWGYLALPVGAALMLAALVLRSLRRPDGDDG